MPAIMIDGKRLDELSLRQIVTACANPERPFFEGGDRMDYTRNINLLVLYADSAALDAEAIADRYHFEIASGGYTSYFNALRAGELIAWATTLGLVIQEGDRWRLVVRERVFDLCGPDLKPRAVRVRGLDGAEAVAAEKIWRRELSRRERARVKRVGQLVVQTQEMIEYIGLQEPDTALGHALQRFQVAGVNTVLGSSALIIGSMADMSVKEADAIYDAVRQIYIDVQHRVHLVRDAERQRQRDEDNAALMAAFAAAATPPAPPRPQLPP